MTAPIIRLFARALILTSIAGFAFFLALVIELASDAGAAQSSTTASELPLPRLEQRRAGEQTSVEEVSSTVMCPTCDTTLDQSSSPAADRMRAYVNAGVAAGWTKAEIRDGLVREYGGNEAILAAPRARGIGLLAWVVPVVVALIALVGGVVVVRRWRTEPELAAADDQARSAVSSSSQSSDGSPSSQSSPEAPSWPASSSAR